MRTSQANRPFLLFDFFFVERKNAGENAKLWGRLKPNARFPQKQNQNIFHFWTNLKAKLWGRLKPNVRFWNVTIDSTTVSVCKIVRTSQAKRPFFNFFCKQKKSQRDREIVRTSQPKRPFLKNLFRFLLLFFSQIWARNQPRNCEDVSGNSSIFVFHFCLWEKKSAGENTKLWGRLTPNARFAPKKNRQFIIFSKIWSRNRQRNYEDVSSQSAIFAFWIFFFERKNAGENAKLWGRLKPNARFPKKNQTIFHFWTNLKAKLWGSLKPNVRFWNVTIDSTTVSVCKIVRTSQAKRPFFKFFRQKKKPARSRNCEDVSAQTPDLEKSVSFTPEYFFH